MVALKEYRHKRHFDKTPEPTAKVRKSPSGRMFVVQKHAASHLHYDFRLELDGVLLSWAVPKGPSLDPIDKRLAMQVEDHPVDYGDFEGIIPEGEYGGGTVMLWDRGEWEPIGDPHEGIRNGHLKFELRGTKLKGRWVLVRIRSSEDAERKTWLLIKEKDRYVRPRGEYSITEKRSKSVATKRSMEQIARQADATWSSNRPKKRTIRKASRSARRVPIRDERIAFVSPSMLTNAIRRPQPVEISPQLATLVREVPRGDQWLHELKFDGYRILAQIENGRVRLMTRRGNDWTQKLPSLAQAVASLGIDNGALDGEVVVLNPDGSTSFQKLQKAFKGLRQPELTYFVFDCPYYGGYDLTATPLIERKEFLQKALESSHGGERIRYSEHVRGDGQAVFDKACELSMEGLVSKRADSSYESRRSHSWLKIKCSQGQEFVIGGFTKPRGTRSGFGALLIGYYDEAGKLQYAGKVGTGFNEKSLGDILRELEKIETPQPPFINPPRNYDAKGVRWTKPALVAEVDFGEWTDDGILRHPTFKGLRADKDPKEVVRESSQSAYKSMKTLRTKKPTASPQGATIAGVALTNPDKVLYSNQRITKCELAEFYESIADYILPHVVRRPLTIVRCPMGQGQKCFYQKHIKETTPDAIYGIPIREGGGVQDYIAIRDLRGLIGLVQMGVLEIHPWGSRDGKIEQPDRVVIDLDPGPGVSLADVVSGALEVRDRLKDLGLDSWPRTSGGKGYHVVIPLVPRADWDTIKEFTRRLAENMVADSPSRYIASMSKAKRGGKIFLDYLRNGRGATSIASYSTRAREHAPVATPLTWRELEKPGTKVDPAEFTLRNLQQRLRKLRKDPWEGFCDLRQSLTRVMTRRMGM